MYREVFGKWYVVHPFLSLLSLPLSVYYSVKQLRKVTHLNKIRFKHILSASLFLVISLFILQLILPLFGIWILEKEIIFFFVFFVLSVVYTLRRYYFSSLGYGIGKIVILITSIVISVCIVSILEFFYGKLAISHGYWTTYANHSILDTVL